MDDNFKDYFTEQQEPESKPAHVETPQEREDREIAESTIERRHSTMRMLLVTAIVLLATFLFWWVWNRYYQVYSEGVEHGWVMKVVNEGTVFKTYEGELLSERYAADTIALTSFFHFTITDDSVAAQTKRLEGSGVRVAVTYQEYKGVLPWRGSSRFIATQVAVDATAPDTTRIAKHYPYNPTR